MCVRSWYSPTHHHYYLDPSPIVMATKRKYPQKIDTARRKAIIEHLKGNVTINDVSTVLKLKHREYIYYEMYHLLKHLVISEKINLEELI